MREAEHAELAQLGNHLVRDVLVLQVPLVRVRQHLGLGEAAHLRRASRSSVSSRPGIAEGGDGRLRGDQLGEPRLEAVVGAGVDEIGRPAPRSGGSRRAARRAPRAARSRPGSWGCRRRSAPGTRRRRRSSSSRSISPKRCVGLEPRAPSPASGAAPRRRSRATRARARPPGRHRGRRPHPPPCARRTWRGAAAARRPTPRRLIALQVEPRAPPATLGLALAMVMASHPLWSPRKAAGDAVVLHCTIAPRPPHAIATLPT